MTDRITSPTARDIVTAVWLDGTRRAGPRPRELQATLAIFRGETGYGNWPAGSEMENSHNWNAGQCPNTGSDCSPEKQRGNRCALHTDTLDGTEKTRFKQCFLTYDTDEEGARAGLKSLYVDRRRVGSVMDTGDSLLIADEMKRSSYYGKAVPTRHYAFMIYSNARELARMLKEPLLVTLRPCFECGSGAGEHCQKGCSGPGVDDLGTPRPAPPRQVILTDAPTNDTSPAPLIALGLATLLLWTGTR